jgi:hypothetical protein
MAGQIMYDLVPPQILTQYVRAYDNEVLKPQAQFVLGQWLPDLMIDDLDYRIRQASLQDVDIAEYRAWDTPAKLTSRPGVTRLSGELGPISRGIMLGEEERLRERTLLLGTNDPIIDAIYADAERMTRSVRARIEMAIGDVINDGTVTIQENGLSLSVNFGRAGAMSVTAAGAMWTDNTNSHPLVDLLGWQETYFSTNGVLPGTLLLPRARLSNFALNAEMRSYAAANGTTPSRLNMQAVNDILASQGLPPIYVYDGQFRKDGSLTRTLPASKAFFLPAPGEGLGNVLWGTTAEALVLQSKGLIERTEAPGLVAFGLTQEHPVQTTTIATAVALPVMPNPNLVMDMTVTA